MENLQINTYTGHAALTCIGHGAWATPLHQLRDERRTGAISTRRIIGGEVAAVRPKEE